jgi:hypothetical protein
VKQKLLLSFGEVRVVGKVTALRAEADPTNWCPSSRFRNKAGIWRQPRLIFDLLLTRLSLQIDMQGPAMGFGLPSFAALTFFLAGVVVVSVSGALRFGGILL